MPASRRRLTGAQVLEQHGTLIEGLRDPMLADITSALMIHHSLFGEPGGLSDPFYPAGHAEEFLAIMHAELSGAETYQVAADLVDDISGTASGTDSGPMTLQEADLPSRAGFVWLDQPVWLSEPDGTRVCSRAVTWGPTTIHGQRSMRQMPGIRVAYWRGVEDTDDFWTPQMSAVWRRTAGDRHGLTLQYARVVPLGRPFHSADGETSRLAPGTGYMEWAQALWRKLVSGVAAEEQAPINADERDRFRKAVPSGRPKVTVMTLRPPEPEGSRVPGTSRSRVGGPVDWTCRWHVDEYVRHVTAPDPPHKAVRSEPGRDSCAACGEPIRAVEGHDKGPGNKPFRDRRRSTVRRLQR